MPLPRTIGSGRALIWYRREVAPPPDTGPVDVAATDPATLSPALWFKADALALSDGAAVSSWTDSSGNGRHATQATAGKQPTYKTNIWNGKPVVRFDGGDGLGTAAADLSAQQVMTWYIVASATDQTTQIFCEFTDNASTNTGAAYMLVDTGSRLEVTTKGNVGFDAWTSLNTFEDGTGTARVMHGVFDMRTGTRHETQGGVDGDTTGRRGAAVNNTGFFANAPFNIGCRDADASAAASSVFLTGDIAEIIVYTGRHTAAQRWGIERYLAEKYAITAWTKPAANLVFEGDSITEGGNSYFSTPYPQRLVNRLKDKVAWFNPAISGQTLNDIVADYSTQIQPESAWANFGTKNIATLFAGTNDMVSVGGNQSGASTATEYLAHADTMRGDGFELIAFTALPRSDAAAPADFYSTQRPAINTAITAGSSHYDVLADVGADSTIGDAGDELNTTYYDVDKVHPNVAGLRHLSGLVAATLSSSFGLETIVPTDLSGLTVWFDASQITGKADGDAIGQWDDASGNAKHATQATGTKQPTYKTAILNGRPVVRFDGGDALQTPSIDLSAATGVTVLVVFNSTVNATDQMVFEFSDNYNNWPDAFNLLRKSDNAAEVGAKGASYAQATAGTVTSAHALISAVINRAKTARESSGWKNGASTASSNTSNNLTGTFGNRPLNIGSRNAASLFLTGDIAELILFSRFLTGGERGRLEEYLAYKWGVF
jgi:hypothetical protein